MFKSVDAKVDFPEMERGILRWWEENNISEKYILGSYGTAVVGFVVCFIRPDIATI